MPQTVRLIPARGKDIKGDLPADGVRESEIGELLFEGGDEFGADVVGFVVGVEVVTFGDGGVAANGGDVDHAISFFRNLSQT